MAIAYIFNGYFRSGTTLLWEILKISNPQCCVFYEPLHPALIHKIHEFSKNQHKVDHIHGKKFWSEYLQQGNSFVSELDLNHVFRKSIFPLCDEDLFKYLNVYNKLMISSILQTNRLHFHLKYLALKYRIKVFHIIRNPFDVYNSLLNIYNKTANLRNNIFRILSYLKNKHSPKSNIFFTKKNINYAFEYYRIPKYWGEKIKKFEVLRNPLKTHILSWVLSNFIVIKDCDKSNIKVFTYEDLINKPEDIRYLIECETDLKFDINIVKKRNIDVNIYEDPKLISVMETIGMTKEYSIILDFIKTGKHG